jgi:hypothetical protein
MKIETTGKWAIILKEVYTGVILKSEKEEISICMRDSGFELTYNGTVFEAKEGLIKYRDVEFPQPGGFQWTDELVKEFILTECNKDNTWSSEGVDWWFKKFKASKQPQPEWEILEGIHLSGFVHAWVEMKVFPYGCAKNGCSIHSVRRLSDGEVFTVGEEFKGIPGKRHLITRFEVVDKNTMAVHATNGNVPLWHLSNLNKISPDEKESFLTKENQDFLADLGSGKIKLPKEATEDTPPAANGKIPVWLTPEQVGKLDRLLALFIDPMAGAVAPPAAAGLDSAGQVDPDHFQTRGLRL